ncbi:acyltransferase family domain-containing protein [Phthorimaea operculella]|nr:acyltransferase family domain-containing protein [Phthorimaea operculella]
MNKTVLFLLVVLLTLAECARVNSRQQKSRAKTARTRILRPKIKTEAVEDLFNVYDPSFLAVVWPKITNGVHLFVQPTCWKDVSVLFNDLADGRAWAYSVVDASGRYESGIFEGNRFWLGSKQECLELDNKYTVKRNDSYDEFQNGDYLNAVLRREKYFDSGTENWRSLIQRDEVMRRLVMADNLPPYRLSYTAVQISLNLTKITMAEAYRITLGVCLPRSCSPEDIESIINFSIMINDNLKTNKTIPRMVKPVSFRQIERHYDITSDIAALLLICVTILLTAIAVTATAVDLKLIKLSVKKVMKPNAMPPSITLDVVSMERVTGSCKRCGKYKKQCTANNLRHSENLPACPRVKSFASITTEPKLKKENLFKSLLLCFSLSYSWKRVFNTNMANKDLSIIHILKIVATFWVIFMHVAIVANYISENSGDINDHNNVYYIIATGTLAFDTLFFVSGLFSAHHYFFLKSQYTVEELVSFGGTCGQILQFICFVTNRAIRLLPSYIYVVFLSGVMSRVSQRTSPLSLPEAEHHNCNSYWWRNVLYVTTLFPQDQQCMQISWYLSVETQLHVFGALACALTSTGRRLVVAIAVSAILISTAADVSGAYAVFGHHLSSAFSAYAVYIDRPLARVAPYFIGMFAGWLVIKLEGRLHINKTRASFLWVTCLTVLVVSLSTPWAFREWIQSWVHPLWPLALLWPALVSATTLIVYTRSILESPAIAALSRLSYSMLLLHGLIARSIMLSDTALCAQTICIDIAALSRLSYSMLLLHGLIARSIMLSDTALCAQTICIWWYFAGTCVLTLLSSLLLSLLVEMPACSLLRRLSDYAS